MPPVGPEPRPHRRPTPLTALVARLREAELAPTAEELADALWLARHVPATDPFASPPDPAVRDGDEPPAPEPTLEPPPPALVRPGSRGPRPGPGAGLYGPAQPEAAHGGPPDGGVRAVPVPAPAVLPDPLGLERSLRPLQRYRPPTRTVRSELDEIATADRAADTGLLVPVLAAVRRREARLALVMDESSSNVVWGGVLDELRRVCERAGAFREVAVHRIGPDDPVPAQLGDPTGRLLTLVLSDCAGPMWRGGRMQRLLYTWASTAPVAVVQPLPQRMWGRTHLPAHPGVLRRREGPAGRLEFTPHRGSVVPHGVAVPVLALRRSSFDAWTRLVAGATGQSLNGAAAIVRRHHRTGHGRPRSAARLDPAERVRLFRRTASPAAAQLAVYLSAVPLVLPVMQLVQRAMLVRSGPDVLAEVLLSGLLRRDETGPAPDEGGPAYTFLDGVREELLGQLGAGSASLVLKHCSEYIESRYGRAVRNFPAMAAAFLTGSVNPRQPAPGGPDSRRLSAFAQVSTQVLRRLGAHRPATTPGELPRGGQAGVIAKARACLTHFDEHGTVRDLDTAIRLLGSAARTERRPTARAGLYEELAGALLRRWLVRPLPEDLPAALEAAQNAISGGPPRAQLTLARVLEIMADEVAAGRLNPKLLPEWVWLQAGDESAEERTDLAELVAAVLLAAADSSLAELTDGPPHGHPSAGDTVIGRAVTGGGAYAGGALRDSATGRAAAAARIRILRRLAVLGAPYALRGPVRPGDWFTGTLRTALAVVQPLVDETVPEALAELRADEHRESAPLVRGGLLLDLARHHRGEGPVPPDTVDPSVSRALAEAAGDDLFAGIDAIDWEAVDPAELRRAWLDYADAIEFTDEHPDDDARLRILQALDQARRNVGRDEAAQAHILLRMAGLLDQRHLATGSWAHRDSAVAAWTEALPLLARDDPDRPAVRTSLGRRLTERGVDKDTAADLHAAVRALRGAIDETPAGDPALPARRALLGQAYIERFRAEETLADLHEAEWTLGAAARAATDPELAAYAWWHRCLAAALLARRTGDRERLAAAIGYYHEAARGTGDLLREAVTAQWARAGLLERSAGPERALEEHRAVLPVLSAAVSDTAELIRREISRLEREAAAPEP
ncbi:SAV_2336 N-terminal domain-related protein [Streptomyces sp. NPDC020965]|uniref:SAV_2336 N-terminal domain-related protein n=1 Tax=Streptomyces sp. NPDC020965 TaxID=3365105 RepID=UPI00378DD201